MSTDIETAFDPERPNIQIDDLVRPMTDDEYAEWLAAPKSWSAVEVRD